MSLSDKLKQLEKAKQKRKKKAIDLTRLSPELRGAYSDLDRDARRHVEGFACKKLIEPLPVYEKADCEKVIEGDNNTYIVLGRDRPKSILSGYGGRGWTGCGSIDIVAGRISAEPGHTFPEGHDKEGQKYTVDPCYNGYLTDASRIVVSQLTDIDKNFELLDHGFYRKDPLNVFSTEGIPITPRDPQPRPAIGIKSDKIRIIGREDVKIVTGTDQTNGMGGSIGEIGGIFLIAGPADQEGDFMEPITKADSMASCVADILVILNELRQIMSGLTTSQIQLNKSITSHVHYSPFYGKPTTPSKSLVKKGPQTVRYHLEQTIMSLKNITANINNIEEFYLKKSGKGYIGSRHNKTN